MHTRIVIIIKMASHYFMTLPATFNILAMYMYNLQSEINQRYMYTQSPHVFSKRKLAMFEFMLSGTLIYSMSQKNVNKNTAVLKAVRLLYLYLKVLF